MQTSLPLLPRSLFSHNTTADFTHTCPLEITTGPPIIPFISQFTFHAFASILSGACALVSTLLISTLIFAHATHYTNAVQQRQIIRIALLIPWVSLWSWLIVWRSDVGDYLVESLDFGCAVALSGFLLLMCDFVLAEDEGWEELFGFGKTVQARKHSPMGLKATWYAVLQFIPTSLLIWASTCISLALNKYCKVSLNIHFSHVWITALKLVVTTVAILASLRFHHVHKQKLQRHRILLKLFTFKSIIGLNVAQTFIISILTGHQILTPTHYLTYHDINTGLASLILACEMPVFALLMVFAFPAKPYRSSPGGPAAGPIVAVAEAFDIRDLLSAFVRGPMRLVREQRRMILRQDSVKVGLVEGEGGGVGV